VLAELMPDEPEVLGLLALMTLQHARRLARHSPDGSLVLLADQDRGLWRWNEIADGLAVLNRALTADSLGAYAIQASIAAHHATARRAEDTDWERVAVLYAELERLTGSPVVRLNRAVAVAECKGPGEALNLLAGLDELLPRHHRLPATRAELLARLGRDTEAVEQYDRALELVGGNAAERAFLCGRRDVSVRRAGGR
jgi:RNA polymerase sigma-70 factor, ECF subfamily